MKTKQTLPVLLAAILQLAPVLRMAAPLQSLANLPASAFILKLAAGAVAYLASYHAVSGATNIVAPYTVNATTGTPYVRQLGTSGQTAFSWSAGTAPLKTAVFPLTPGLWLTNTTGRIGGTPVWAGVSNIVISAWEFAGNTGNSVSQTFVITITNGGPPIIFQQPVGQTNNLGSNTTFSVTAFGKTNLAYQWRFNSTPIPGATTNTWVQPNIQPTDAGQYSVVITNSLGSLTSSIVTLGIKSPPFISAQPTNLAVLVGSSATFSVTAGGSTPLTYQWKFNGANISLATASSYSIGAAKPSDVGTYSVAITNSLGFMISSNATLSVLVPPFISAPPVALATNAGSTVNFSVTAGGSTPLTYQWLKNNSPIAGATTSAYAILSAQSGDAGNYSVNITNLAGFTNSTAVSLVINSPSLPVTLSPAMVNNLFTAQFAAQVGSNYVVKTSSNLLTWTTLTNIVANSTSAGFSDSVTNSYRYYRVQSGGN